MLKHIRLLVAFVMLTPAFLWAQTTFTTFDAPGSTSTGLTDITAAGDFCGGWSDAAGIGHGLVVLHGQFQSIDYPSATNTFVIALNARGDMAGDYGASDGVTHAFLWLRAQQPITIDPPGASSAAVAQAVNNRDDVTGWYYDSSGTMHGFEFSGGTFTTIDYPGASSTDAWSINDVGDVVGSYQDATGTHGFLLSHGVFTSLPDYPAAVGNSQIVRRTDSGDMLGRYFDSNGNLEGFLVTKGDFSAINIPPGIWTNARGLNARGQIVGGYKDSAGQVHGFIASK